MDVFLQPQKEINLKSALSISNMDESSSIDLKTGLVFCNHEQKHEIVFKLGKRDVAVLNMLIEFNGAPVSRAKLLDHIWRDRVVTDNVLTVSISNIRKAFKFLIPSGEQFIVTINGIGYFIDINKAGLIVFCEND